MIDEGASGVDTLMHSMFMAWYEEEREREIKLVQKESANDEGSSINVLPTDNSLQVNQTGAVVLRKSSFF